MRSISNGIDGVVFEIMSFLKKLDKFLGFSHFYLFLGGGPYLAQLIPGWTLIAFASALAASAAWAKIRKIL